MPLAMLLHALVCAAGLVESQSRSAPVEVYNQGSPEGITFRARNNWRGTVALALRLKAIENLRQSPAQPVQPFPTGEGGYFLLPKGADLPLYELKRVDPQQGVSVGQSQFFYVLGDPQAKPDGFVYYYPLRVDSAFIQGFDSQPTHKSWQRYALDFGVPEGTPVYAARGGVVVEPGGNPEGDGNEPVDEKGGNMVQILHADGTQAVYAHLQDGGVLVHPGDEVKDGQLIARSGKTGTASVPHLHFAVWVVGMSSKWSAATKTVKFSLRGASGSAYALPKRESVIKSADLAVP